VRVALARRKSFDWRENPLILAVLISVATHATLYFGWKLGNRFDWWKNQPAWLQKLSNILSKPPTPKKFPQPQNQVPLIFVDVDPQMSVTEAPKDAKFYGAMNSKAASEKEKPAELPEILGKQEKVIKATENSPSKAQPLQPSPPKEEKTEAQESKPKEKQVPGDLALAKPQDQNKKAEGEDEKEHVRPRKLSEVKPSLLGEKMKQPGGAKRLALSPAFDVKATSFGDYDRQFIEAVQHRWYELLEDRNTVPGKIVLEFRLNYDGRITDLKLIENTTQSPLLELICKSAIDDPSPYRKWPSEMRREMKSDSREVRFTFYYE
jgi:hypothetical protein